MRDEDRFAYRFAIVKNVKKINVKFNLIRNHNGTDNCLHYVKRSFKTFSVRSIELFLSL